MEIRKSRDCGVFNIVISDLSTFGVPFSPVETTGSNSGKTFLMLPRIFSYRQMTWREGKSLRVHLNCVQPPNPSTSASSGIFQTSGITFQDSETTDQSSEITFQSKICTFQPYCSYFRLWESLFGTLERLIGSLESLFKRKSVHFSLIVHIFGFGNHFSERWNDCSVL